MLKLHFILHQKSKSINNISNKIMIFTHLEIYILYYEYIGNKYKTFHL